MNPLRLMNTATFTAFGKKKSDFRKKQKSRQNGGVHKAVNRHSGFRCVCSCISGQVMIFCNESIKPEFDGVLPNERRCNNGDN